MNELLPRTHSVSPFIQALIHGGRTPTPTFREPTPQAGLVKPDSVTLVGRKGSSQTVVQYQPSQSGILPKLNERLFALKAKTGLVAMHLSSDWRAGLFSQLDFLLAEENWEGVDSLPTKESYDTALRLIIFLGEVRRPGLGLTHDGNVILTWTTGRNRLTIECQADDAVKWIVAHYVDGKRETAAGLSTAKRVPTILSAYSPEQWLSTK